MATAEALIDSGCQCLFVTHFSQISCLETVYPTVRNIHLSSSTAQHPSDRMKPLHKLQSGVFAETYGYGISMAEACGFPEAVIRDASAILDSLKSAYPVMFKGVQISKGNIMLNNLLSSLIVLRKSTLDTMGLRTYLQSLSAKLSAENARLLLGMVKSAIDSTELNIEKGNNVPPEDKKNKFLDIIIPLNSQPTSPEALVKKRFKIDTGMSSCVLAQSSIELVHSRDSMNTCLNSL